MKRRIGKLSVILSAVIFATAAISACRKKDDISEITRTFEYTKTQIETTKPEKTTEESKETTIEKETTKESTKETTQETTRPSQKETTTKKELTGAAVYFEDKNSVFNTLPSFDAGVYEEYFNQGYVEGLRFSNATESSYSEYLQAVLNEGKYTLNSQDGTRAYPCRLQTEICV